MTYLAAHPALLRELLYFSLSSAFGQIFIFWTMRTFSALTLSTITTTRKFFTIVVSVVYYGHVLTQQQWAAVAVVFGGLALEVFAKDDKHGGHSHHGHGHGGAAAAPSGAADAPAAGSAATGSSAAVSAATTSNGDAAKKLHAK